MTEKYGMRTDCTRDNRQTICKNASSLGYSTYIAKRGSWITYENDQGHLACGRVVGRVHCEGKTYLEIIQTNAAFTMAYARWIDPLSVRECYNAPHRRVIAFLTGEWKDADTILRTAHNGHVRAEEDT